MLYQVLVRREMEGTVDVDAASESEAERLAEKEMETGSGEIDWHEPNDSIVGVELQED